MEFKFAMIRLEHCLYDDVPSERQPGAGIRTGRLLPKPARGKTLAIIVRTLVDAVTCLKPSVHSRLSGHSPSLSETQYCESGTQFGSVYSPGVVSTGCAGRFRFSGLTITQAAR